MDVENKKWVAGGGTTALGIIGTTLGGLNAVTGNGLLGGITGNGDGGGKNCGHLARENAELRERVATLTSEKYTDQAILGERDLHLGWVKELASVDARLDAVDDKLETAVAKNKEDIAAVRKEMELNAIIAAKQSKIDMLEMERRVDCKIDSVAVAANNGIAANTGAIACLQTLVNGITKTVIPQSAVCNTSYNSCCSGCVQQ